MVHDLPGVGQNFRDHALVPILFHIDEQFIDDAQGPRLQIGLRYTVPGSSIRNDMQITPSWFTDHAATPMPIPTPWASVLR